VKQHIPATLVIDIGHADCQLKATSQPNASLWQPDSGWQPGWFLRHSKDKIEGTLEVIDLGTQTIVWAGEAGNRSLMWSPLRRNGNRKLAARIVKQIKHAGLIGGCFTSPDPFK
jgi:hypothetical protein